MTPVAHRTIGDKPSALYPPPVAQGGGGGDDGSMRERLATIEALLPTLATKADLMGTGTIIEGVRADIFKMDASVKTWMIATVIALFGAGIAMSFGLFNAIRSQAPASLPQQAPPQIIYIQPPTQPSPAPTPPAQ